MASKALIVLVGHVGSVEELKQTSKGTPVLGFSLAVNTGYGDRKICTWYRCSFFGKGAEAVAQYIEKGKNLMVTGEPCLENWEKQDGTKGQSLKVFVQDLTLLSSGQQQEQPAGNADDDGDLLF